ncbi:MAG: Spy/CpxP family protein refolding chaperone [candidate division KSB1 bacterium]|nr:Spy/CpxP family protein refolding chaperone [candidate division KSB1 bacterium]MDZ7336470.1 Spy/CpxP family protein refolding chaperone [candidate division KSB1 bacterium]MDZ7402123.1 Spy/CpxP family protein refolding chaperone [candidate division KSB1 bacterium]
MRRKIIFSVLVASLVVATGLLAQRPDRLMLKKQERKAMLDLTDEQEAKIRDLELKLEKEIMPLRSQIPGIEANLKQELVAKQFNQTRVKNLIEQKAKIESEIELKQLLHQRAIRDLLTPEQQKKFDLHALRGGMGRHGMHPLPLRPPMPGGEVPQPESEK